MIRYLFIFIYLFCSKQDNSQSQRTKQAGTAWLKSLIALLINRISQLEYVHKAHQRF